MPCLSYTINGKVADLLSSHAQFSPIHTDDIGYVTFWCQALPFFSCNVARERLRPGHTMYIGQEYNVIHVYSCLAYHTFQTSQRCVHALMWDGSMNVIMWLWMLSCDDSSLFTSVHCILLYMDIVCIQLTHMVCVLLFRCLSRMRLLKMANPVGDWLLLWCEHLTNTVYTYMYMCTTSYW